MCVYHEGRRDRIRVGEVRVGGGAGGGGRAEVWGVGGCEEGEGRY